MFDNKMEEYLSLVNKALAEYSVFENCCQNKLKEAVNYSLLAEGKRLRPVILLASCEMAGGDILTALPFAIGLEMIHNSSLIHDDLPAMDNDDLRRGRPTNHKVYGEATAILAGDVLLVKPFEIMASVSYDKRHMEAIRIIAESAGDNGMMGGQQIDLDCENNAFVTADQIITLNNLKTGALFKAAVTAGVVLAGAEESKIVNAGKYGEYLGLAFQLVDDLLDNDDNAVTGKTKGSDAAQGKSTYLSLYGEEKCRSLIDECTLKASESLDCFGDNAYFLIKLVEKLAKRIK